MAYVVIYRHANGSINFVHDHVDDEPFPIPTEFDTFNEAREELRKAKDDHDILSADIAELT